MIFGRINFKAGVPRLSSHLLRRVTKILGSSQSVAGRYPERLKECFSCAVVADGDGCPSCFGVSSAKCRDPLGCPMASVQYLLNHPFVHRRRHVEETARREVDSLLQGCQMEPGKRRALQTQV